MYLPLKDGADAYKNHLDNMAMANRCRQIHNDLVHVL